MYDNQVFKFSTQNMKCILCRGNDFKLISEKDSKNKGELFVCVCNTCSMVSQNPIPTEQQVEHFYASKYRQDYKQVFEPKLKHVYRAGNLALNRLGLLTKNNIASGKLLDVGAGGGEFTYVSSQLGFDSTGVEPNIGYSNYARDQYQANVKTGQLADVDGKFDVITMFHVMEHIPDPVKTFKKLYDLLNEDGSLFIEVPNIESFSQSPDNTFFKAHIHYFSATTLIACASQYFVSVDLDNSDNNISVLFNRRSSVKEFKLPTKIDIDASKTILTHKSWFNYVFKGKGYQKAFNRIMVIIQDKRLVKANPKEILDGIVCK
jgi:2-polyprenyl-3-methyl-5-hydroxy-6-metoxy-1,4-benzoquinol methylase